MEKQLEQYFGCKIKATAYKSQLSLPFYMTIRNITMLEIYGISFALVDVKKETELSVTAMKKQKCKYEEALRCPVAYSLSLSSLSLRNALIKNGISFIDLPQNIFLPFMGIVLQDVYKKHQIKINQMMPATQMVFLKLLYMDDEKTMLKGEMAKQLNLTKTSITRATAQLAEMGLIQQVKSGTAIAIRRNYARKKYYENAKIYLINPVQKELAVFRDKTFCESFTAGESALSQASDLNPPKIEERAIFKNNVIVDNLKVADVRSEDPRNCLKIQLWKYDPSYFAKEGCVDPVSLACTFKEFEDERIEMSIDELLEAL